MKKYRILLVEDNYMSIDLIVQTLSDYYTLMIAKDAESSLALMNDHLPDLILMDIVLPDMDGLALYSKLSKDQLTKGIPVIFLSGMADSQTKAKAFAMGAADFIEKPFDLRDLKIRIKRLFE